MCVRLFENSSFYHLFTKKNPIKLTESMMTSFKQMLTNRDHTVLVEKIDEK